MFSDVDIGFVAGGLGIRKIDGMVLIEGIETFGCCLEIIHHALMRDGDAVNLLQNESSHT